ncbi:MAG: dicarboxylate/amino acid:cation symporter, partial [Proteobacteria bacterium]|nr:dicarboxylate/amino acid:cation symporter [Pseudomonadota bacterium]
ISAWLALPGNLFLTFIRFIIIPSVISSVMLGIAGSNDIAKVRKIGGAIVVYFVITSAVAATISIVVTTFIAPGAMGGGDLGAIELTRNLPTAQSLGDDLPRSIVNLFPTNPVASMAEGKLLEIVIASVIFGVALLVMKKSQAKPMLKVLESIQGASLIIIDFIMRFAPIAVFGLISKVVIESGFEVIGDLGAYMATFLLILFLILGFYALVLKLYVGRSPLEFAGKIREPFILAFSTSSSSATMPVTLRTAETKLKVEPTVARLVVPVGATINLDGTAAYQSVVIIFLAQFFGIDLSMFQIISLVSISVLASIGAPGVPGGSLAILIGILASFGIPNEGFALILAVDRILDMCRTSVNVTGDLVTCTVMQKISGSRASP